MDVPRINPVGLLELPEDHAGTPRTHSPAWRLVVGLFLVVFFAATVLSTVLSLGAYCLSTDGANVRALAAGLAALPAEKPP